MGILPKTAQFLKKLKTLHNKLFPKSKTSRKVFQPVSKKQRKNKLF